MSKRTATGAAASRKSDDRGPFFGRRILWTPRLSHGLYTGLLALAFGSLVLIVLVTADSLRRRGIGETINIRTHLEVALSQEKGNLETVVRLLSRMPNLGSHPETLSELDLDALWRATSSGRVFQVLLTPEATALKDTLEGDISADRTKPTSGFQLLDGQVITLAQARRADGTFVGAARLLDLEGLARGAIQGHDIAPFVRISETDPQLDSTLPLRGPGGEHIGTLIWSDTLSLHPLTQLAWSLLSVLVLLSFSAYLVWLRQREYVTALDRSARELAVSEVRFRDFAESSSDWFWETNGDLEYTYISPRLEHLPREDQEAILGRSFRNLCLRNLDQEDWLDICTANLVNHKAFRDLNLTTTLSDGRRHHFRISGRPVHEGGVFVGFRGSGIDVTQELQASDNVQAMRDLLVDAVGSISEGFILFAPDGQLVVVNEQYRRAYPLLAAHLVPGVTFEDLLRIAAKGEDIRDENALRGWLDLRLKRHRDGGVTDCRLSNGRWYRISEHSTRGGGIVKVLMDITELKTKTDRLVNQTALLEATFGAMDQGIAVFGPDRRLKAFNPRLHDLMGYPKDLCRKGCAMAEILAYDRERGVTMASLDNHLTEDSTLRDHSFGIPRVSEITLPNGRVLENHLSRLPDNGHVMTLSDISDLKRQQRVLANLAASSSREGLNGRGEEGDILMQLGKGLATALDMDRVIIAERSLDDPGLRVLARVTRDGLALPWSGPSLSGPLVERILKDGLVIESRDAAHRFDRDPLAILALDDLPMESLMAQVLRDDDGSIVGILAALGTHPMENLAWAQELLPVFTARTEAELVRQRAAISAREGEALLRTFVEYTPAAVAMVDRDMRYLRVSRRWIRDFRLEGRTIIGERHHDILPDIPDDWWADYNRALTGAVIDHDEICLELGGKTVWLRRQEHPWFRGDGSVGGIMMFAEVITDRKQAELALQQAQKMDAVGQLAGGIAHEFNNMLTSIGGFARMATRDLSNTSRVSMCLAEVTKSSDRAAALTTQLLNFSRRASSEEILPVSLGEALADLRAFLKPILGEQVQLALKGQGESLTVLANPDRLHQALVNLCINARDAMPLGGTISLTVGIEPPSTALRRRHAHLLDATYAVITVSDTGTGIPEDILPRVFEPFFTTKEQGKGTGLGLPMVYAMAEQAGGAVDVESTLAVGTRFTLYLPLGTREDDLEDIPDIMPSARGDAVILLAEDEASVRRYAQLVLEDHGYTVLTATNGREAAEIWNNAKDRVDLLITDLVMPELGGPELIEHVLRDREDLKVILISGYSNHPAWTEGEDRRWRRLLGKPVRPETLLSTVEELLSR
ncbi:MAG: PAS-domain containing protein [Rhodospirillum sp.]|nr:PAS-domain containing protein [Rhodospirillum sp.]MCF8489366.1 PAS-domain containing protein [Rhodospirillum sp.]MCF8502699.1 PAS-domain containing protein [Rhodospirillum sp.]